MNPNQIKFRIVTLQPSNELSAPIKTLYQTERTKRWFNYEVRTCNIISKCVDLQVAQSNNRSERKKGEAVDWECVGDLRSCFKLISTDGGTKMKLQVVVFVYYPSCFKWNVNRTLDCYTSRDSFALLDAYLPLALVSFSLTLFGPG